MHSNIKLTNNNLLLPYGCNSVSYNARVLIMCQCIFLFYLPSKHISSSLHTSLENKQPERRKTEMKDVNWLFVSTHLLTYVEFYTH